MAQPFRSDDEILAMATDQSGAAGDPRCRFVTGVLPLAGYSDVEVADIEFPYDTPAQQRALASQLSTCGIVTEVGWRFANVQDQRLLWSYQKRLEHGEQAVTLEKNIATDVGAWVSAIPWVEGTPLPTVGDAPIIGCKSCGSDWARNVSNLEHEYTIVANDPQGGGLHHSVDGGQPGVKFRSRCWLEVWTGTNKQGQRTGELWAATCGEQGQPLIAADGRPQSGRRAIGYTSVVGLPLGDSNGSCVGDTLTRKVVRNGKKVVIVGLVGILAFLAATKASNR